VKLFDTPRNIMKILIADDHRLVIEAVKSQAVGARARHRVRPGNERRRVAAAVTDDVDLAVIDLNMPGADGQAHIDESAGAIQRCR
jgi:DNA-binding NarL/FixJ family response regulator